MSPKTAKPAKLAKIANKTVAKPASLKAAKAPAKAETKSLAKASPKSLAKSSPKASPKSLPKSLKDAPLDLEAGPAVSAEQAMIEAEEAEEQAELAAARSGGGGGGDSALAAAAAAGPTGEMSASFKNFRHHPDMENFYRFIHDHDLRIEAKAIIDQILVEKHTRKAVKVSKSVAH